MSTESTSPAIAVSATIPVPAPGATAPAKLWASIGVRQHLAVVLTLSLLALLTFANSFQTGFALDNKFLVLDDPRMRETSWDNVQLIFTQDYWFPKAVSGLFRPVTTLSYWFNYAVLENTDRPGPYHTVNFVLHWLNACLVYFLVLVLLGNLWAAFFVAALFTVHPVTTESVTNIIGRSDLLSTACVLGGFLCHAKAQAMGHRPLLRRPLAVAVAVGVTVLGAVVLWKLPAWSLTGWYATAVLAAVVLAGLVAALLASGWPALPWLLGLQLLTLIGVFSKESAVVVLGVIVLYDLLARRAPPWPNGPTGLAAHLGGWFARGYVAVLPVLGVLWYVRHLLFSQMRPPELPFVDNPLVAADFWTARLTAIKVIGKYFWLLLWPQSLSCDYSYNQIPVVSWTFTHWEDWKGIIALVAVVAVLLVALRNWRRNRMLSFFILLFFVALAPTANLFLFCGSIMAERFLYLPLIGFAGWLVLAVYGLCRRLVVRIEVSDWGLHIWLRLFARSVLFALVAGYGVRTFFRNFDWENDVTLWTAAVAAAPNSFKTHKSLAFALYEQDPEGKEINLVIEEGEKAKAITDQTQIVLLHLGAYYRLKGDSLAQRAPDGTLMPTAGSQPWYAKSAEVLAQAIPLDRAFNEDNRRKQLARGDKSEEILDVGNHEIYWNLGLAYMRLSKYQEALAAYQYMRHLAPTNPDAYLSIASVELSLGQLEPAALSLIQTLLLDTKRQEALRLLVDLYRQTDREGCAVLFADGQPRLNMDCRVVHDQMCAAYAGLVGVFLGSHQPGLARNTRDNALTLYKCAAEPFDRLLPPAAVPAAPAATGAPTVIFGP